jgi:hypothetical protein
VPMGIVAESAYVFRASMDKTISARASQLPSQA